MTMLPKDRVETTIAKYSLEEHSDEFLARKADVTVEKFRYWRAGMERAFYQPDPTL